MEIFKASIAKEIIDSSHQFVFLGLLEHSITVKQVDKIVEIIQEVSTRKQVRFCITYAIVSLRKHMLSFG